MAKLPDAPASAGDVIFVPMYRNDTYAQFVITDCVVEVIDELAGKPLGNVRAHIGATLAVTDRATRVQYILRPQTVWHVFDTAVNGPPDYVI